MLILQVSFMTTYSYLSLLTAINYEKKLINYKQTKKKMLLSYVLLCVLLCQLSLQKFK